MESFYDECRLRKGVVYNPGWCGSCGLSNENKINNVNEYNNMLKNNGHKCMILNGTLLWWCNEKTCKPENANKRDLFAHYYVEDGNNYFGPYNPSKNADIVNDDIRYLLHQKYRENHYCPEKIKDYPHDIYKWCGQDICPIKDGEQDFRF